MKGKYFLTAAALILLVVPLFAQSIAEKKALLQKGGTDLDRTTEGVLTKVNEDLLFKKRELKQHYSELRTLRDRGVDEIEYLPLLDKIQVLRKEIQEINEQWQNDASLTGKGGAYGLWNEPEATLEDLIIDYGSMDYVYVMPHDVASLKISLISSLPIPRSAWGEMMDQILTANGIGSRQLSPYLKELYQISKTNVPVKFITNNEADLNILPQEARIAFLLTPQPSEVRRTWTFLDKFANPNTTILQQIGRDILLIGQVSDLQDLMRLYNFVDTHKSKMEYKLIPLFRIKAEEMAKVIASMFDQFSESDGQPTMLKQAASASSAQGGNKTPSPSDSGGLKIKRELTNVNGLKIIVLESLTGALFLVGTPEEIRQAEQMIRSIENQIAAGREKVIQWYAVKYSYVDELAQTLQQVYDAIIQQHVSLGQPSSGHGGPSGPGTPGSANQQNQQNQQNPQSQQVSVQQPAYPRPPEDVFREAYYQGGEVVVNPAPVGPSSPEERNKKKPKLNLPNFITDEKTGSIIMVIEKELVPRIMEIIAMLDVPKKMVQIDVLLFERKITNTTDYGLNLLTIGSHASNTRQTGIDWNNTALSPANQGIFEFFISRIRGNGMPAYDLQYKFMLAQTDVRINANPSVITVNQTPAFISIVEEQSINTGTAFISITNSVTPTIQFTRAQYGITLEITPTIHWAEEQNSFGTDINFITLDTKVNFDTTDPNSPAPDQPNVTRREIKNQVVLGDGQTVVLGGLRRKNSSDGKEAIPFLGEVPGFGKLFSINSLHDDSTEMFIFLTPRIIVDPCEDIERIKAIKVSERPGDIPDFVWRYYLSKDRETECLFNMTLRVLFGQPMDRIERTQHGCAPSWSTPGDAARRQVRGARGSCGEYDGR